MSTAITCDKCKKVMSAEEAKKDMFKITVQLTRHDMTWAPQSRSSVADICNGCVDKLGLDKVPDKLNDTRELLLGTLYDFVQEVVDENRENS